VFEANAPGASEGPAAVQALDQALGQLLGEIVRWAAPYL
jgi:cholesterol transport system auxiliary component